ncbi:phage protein NinX family protein [Trinickia violacea]|nr:phage protein NinX family protein [Trinickia violacea]
MNVEELCGAELDYEVALAEGFEAQLCRMYGWSYCRIDVPHHGYSVYEPTHNWQLAGRIYDRQHYTLYPRLDRRAGGAPPVWVWLAEAQNNPHWRGQFVAESPLVAICRLRVAEAAAERTQHQTTARR